MEFKKYAEKKLSKEETVIGFQVRAAKIVFLFAALFFFINIFLIGSDQNNEYSFLEKLLPATYSIFIASLMFLGLAAVKHFTRVKHKNIAHILNIVVIIVFSIPLLVFFIGKDHFIGIL